MNSVPTAATSNARCCLDCGREWESPMGSSFVCPGCGLVQTLLGNRPLQGELDAPLRIEGVAMFIQEVPAEVVVLAAPGRHHDLVRTLVAANVSPGRIATSVQGFYDNKGHFFDRRGALAVAYAAGQVRVKTAPDDLLSSEDLW